MINYITTIFITNLENLIFNSKCLDKDFIKSFNDIYLQMNGNLNFLNVEESNFEKNENVNIMVMSYDSWSIFFFETLTFYLVMIILSFPLIFCLILLVFYLNNQIKVYMLGNLTKIEYRNFNFYIFSKELWRIIWLYSYYFMPRYVQKQLIIEQKNLTQHLEFKFPNPKHVLAFYYKLFYNDYKPKFLKYFIYLNLILFAFFFSNLENLPIFFICYYISLYIDDWWDWDNWTFGYKLHRIFTFYQKKKNCEREDIFENAHLNSRAAFYPIFGSFLLFLLTTSLLFLMYGDFFFNPILTWNGYFSKTIISYFFLEASTTTRLAKPIVFDYFIALDGLNIWLIWLTSLLVYLCSLFLLDTNKLHNFFSQLGWIFLLEFASFQFFCVPNYLWMYIYFELSLLPIFILIVFWGSNWWKIHAAYQMVLFTFIGSLFLLAGIFLLYIKIWTFNCFDIFYVTQSENLNIIFTNFEKKLIWILLFIGFAVKTPLYPFHIWLPEAHSEAPTTGSVLLAGVLLKMGTYGFLRFVIPLFPSILETFKTLVFAMCLCGILLSSLAALAQIDIKKIIAYSSIGHMGLVILGIYSMNIHGLMGASYMMLSHGLVSSALFFSIGILYKIYGTWSIVYYTSIAHFMPKFSMCFFIFSLANMSFPGTAGFPGEILIFTGLMADNFFLSLFVGLGSIFGGVYSIWLLTRILYGQISPKVSIYRDIKPTEKKILNFLTILILLFGIFPFLLLDFFKPMCFFFISLSNT